MRRVGVAGEGRNERAYKRDDPESYSKTWAKAPKRREKSSMNVSNLCTAGAEDSFMLPMKIVRREPELNSVQKRSIDFWMIKRVKVLYRRAIKADTKVNILYFMA